MIVINKNTPNFKSLYWVCLATAKKDLTRPSLCCVQVVLDSMMDTLKFTGCDGHRLHVFTADAGAITEDFEEGLYSIAKVNRSEIQLHKNIEDLTYPEVSRVIPDLSKGVKTEIHLTGSDSVLSHVYAIALRMLPDQESNLHVDYFKDLISVGSEQTAVLRAGNKKSKDVMPKITVEMPGHFGLLLGMLYRNQ